MALDETLRFHMSHRLFGIEPLFWFKAHMSAHGLEGIHAARMPNLESKKDHQVSIFEVDNGAYALLEGHHRVVAACVLAASGQVLDWRDHITLRLHRPNKAALRLWRQSIVEMDQELCARFSMFPSADRPLGTVRECVDVLPHVSDT